MKKIIRFTLVSLFFFASSCEVEKGAMNHQSFFDLNDFLKKETAALADLKSIKKRVNINGKTDEQVLEKFDLVKDLIIFKNSNINKIAWLDKYEVDSIINNSGQLTELKYRATDQKLKTQLLTINYSAGKVDHIFIKNISSNQVTDLEQNLHYRSMKGYSVVSNQKVSLSDEQVLKIEVEYLTE